MVPSTKANMELNVKTHAPRHTIAIVRTPAGRSARRRSKPMMVPISIETRTRQHSSASQGLRPSSTSYLRHRHGSGRYEGLGASSRPPSSPSIPSTRWAVPRSSPGVAPASCVHTGLSSGATRPIRLYTTRIEAISV
eukprot:scaffold31002_cov68-Phaeocystis_antarctica.AAC.2